MDRPLLNRRLAEFGTTIFAEMSALAVRTGSINLGQGFPDADGPEEVREAAVRALITDQLTGLDRRALIDRRERKKILKRLVKAIHHETDEHVAEVLFTDITIQ